MATIKPPVSNPSLPAGSRGVYSPVWEAVKSLAPGNWLPVECQDKAEVIRLLSYAQRRGIGYRTGGLTLYLRNKLQS